MHSPPKWLLPAYYGCLLIFNTPTGICLAQQAALSQHWRVGHPYHVGVLQQTLLDATTQDWEQVYCAGCRRLDAQVEAGA